MIVAEGIIISSGIIEDNDDNVGNGEIFSDIGGNKLTVTTSGMSPDVYFSLLYVSLDPYDTREL